MAEEKIVESGSYRNFEIHATDKGRFIAVVYGVKYILDTLQQVMDMIDDLFKIRRN